jgi:hypothetical protein
MEVSGQLAVPGKEPLGTHRIGEWVAPGAKKISYACRESNPGSPACKINEQAHFMTMQTVTNGRRSET